MNATIINVMSPIYGSQNVNDTMEKLRLIAGQNAAICYLKDSYFTATASPDSSLKRFDRVSSSGHHSIADHSQIEILFEDIPKALAMVLNNLTFYAASEKSGRYTELKASTDIEKQKYDKWKKLFPDIIRGLYPELTDSHVEKLAQENARYMLDIFTPSTTLGYTTSLRQWCYIADWCDRFVEKNSKPHMLTDVEKRFNFNNKLAESFKWLSSVIHRLGIYDERLSDIKPRSIEEFTSPIFLWSSGADVKMNPYTDSFTYDFVASPVAIAQLQRHRTIKLKMYIPDSDFEPFMPPILNVLSEGNRVPADMTSDWLNDIRELNSHGIFTQANRLRCRINCDISSFIMMCEERLCGRAQLETYRIVSDMYYQLYQALKNNIGIFSPEVTEPIKTIIDNVDIGGTSWDCKINFTKCKRIN